MRQAYKVWIAVAAAVFCVVALADLGGGSESRPVASRGAPPTTTSARPSTTAPTSAVVAPSSATPVATVASAVDGDTLLVGGQQVRVLGLDACPAATSGGRAAVATAQGLVTGRPAVLGVEPGVDRDGSGRLLRYVEVDGADLATTMVAYPHSGVAAGDGAAADYVGELRASDPNGRTCSAPTTPTPTPTTTSAPGYDDDGDVDVDLPSPGDQGLPDGALSGGYCARKWRC